MKKLLKVCLFFIIISAPAAVYSQDTTDAVGYGITGGRARSLIGTGMGLISIITGGLALIRSRSHTRRKGGQIIIIAALVSGLTGIILSLVHLGSSTGGFGTGGGRAGAIAALIFSLIGITLSGISLARHKRNNRGISSEITENQI
jgi:hypothetical protein